MTRKVFYNLFQFLSLALTSPTLGLPCDVATQAPAAPPVPKLAPAFKAFLSLQLLDPLGTQANSTFQRYLGPLLLNFTV